MRRRKLPLQKTEAMEYSTQTDRPITSTQSLVVEAPLRIKVNAVSFTMTMRTPGNDEALARGLLYTEGIYEDLSTPLAFAYTKDPSQKEIVCVNVALPEEYVEKSIQQIRSLIATSSCGLCGREELEDIEGCEEPTRLESNIDRATLDVSHCFDQMKTRQKLFEETGGCHAAALFDKDLNLLTCHEDIGRHNAVDKVIGSLLKEEALPKAEIMTVSGRISFEILYKAWKANIPILLAVSAPSSLAVELAQKLGMTIYGFCRSNRYTIYTST